LVASGTASAQLPAGIPDYYPKDYAQIVEASKKENRLVVYSIMAEYNWKPVLEGFKKHYPWIQVQTLDLGSSEVFERYYAERAANSRTADLMIVGAIDKWMQMDQRGEILDYESAESSKLPAWSKPRKGLYTVSSDPMLLVWNKALVPDAKAPKSLADLAKLVAESPARMKNKVTTYDAGDSFGLAINWSFIKKHGEAGWKIIDTLGSVARPEGSAGPMVEKVTAGEYQFAYFVSSIVVMPRLNDPARAKILGWAFPTDGTPIVLRGMAIPKGSTNVNAAKLMLDYIVSREGMIGFGKGGLTPYRDDIKGDDVPRFTYKKVAEMVGGEDKLIIVDYDTDIMTKGKDFVARWNKAFLR